jgi:hypothetical protein
VVYERGGKKHFNITYNMRINEPNCYESVPAAEKALRIEVDKIRQQVEEGGYVSHDLQCHSDYYFESLDVKEKTHIIAHLFNMPGEEEMIEQLNQWKIPDELGEAFQSNNCSLSKEVSIAGVEGGWVITDGIEMYSVKKSEEQLSVYSCCKATEIFFTDQLDKKGNKSSRDEIMKYYYLQKGPVVYRFEVLSADIIYEDLDKRYFEPMLATFEPIVVITEPTQ